MPSATPSYGSRAIRRCRSAPLLLNCQPRLIEYADILRGAIHGAPGHPRKVVQKALRMRGSNDMLPSILLRVKSSSGITALRIMSVCDFG